MKGLVKIKTRRAKEETRDWEIAGEHSGAVQSEMQETGMQKLRKQIR